MSREKIKIEFEDLGISPEDERNESEEKGVLKCPNCGSFVSLSMLNDEMLRCSKCGCDIEVGNLAEQSCPFCGDAFGAEDSLVVCPDCKAIYHSDCWKENRGCSTYGCESARHVEIHNHDGGNSGGEDVVIAPPADTSLKMPCVTLIGIIWLYLLCVLAVVFVFAKEMGWNMRILSFTCLICAEGARRGDSDGRNFLATVAVLSDLPVLINAVMWVLYSEKPMDLGFRLIICMIFNLPVVLLFLPRSNAWYRAKKREEELEKMKKRFNLKEEKENEESTVKKGVQE